ncbi:helix-turn-helix domain-containing protein [Dyadobacter sp. CY326]|uniref:helix-turn-helix domain-containing protein n=1 Tax=Dyadobacter sp. CY326 TaxID=2907300 RepID=UPI001F26BA6F|nr:helix-turn-helix domain-containing protein [Dyadobacter sp. CY326]MCE7065418.1 helix-turn-helix domain-containing protein [Dyadobacter sp. CY326]
MKYFTIPPSPALAKYVRFFWVLEHEVGSGKPYIHRTMADGCAELIFHYKGRFDEFVANDKTESSFHSGIHGQSQYFRRFVIQEDFGIFGVYLYPFAIPVLFGMPSTELTDQMPDIQTFLGKKENGLEERMMLAKDHIERVAVISGFLESLLMRNMAAEPAVFSVIHDIIRNNGLTNVQRLAEQSFLSTRQFERKFKAFSGFSPKLYLRIIRFQHALDAYGSKDKSLTEIAYECGYYDQSHFIHDFKAFSGQHPRFYFSGKTEGSEYRDA